jgi:transposase-like protein
MIMTVDEARERIQTAIARRESAGQKVEDIAKEIGISVPTLYRWRRGKRIDAVIAAAITLVAEPAERQAA